MKEAYAELAPANEVRISTNLKRLAKVMNKPKNQVIETALKQYISEQSDQIAGIQQAQKTLAKGAGKDFDTIVAALRTKIRHKR